MRYLPALLISMIMGMSSGVAQSQTIGLPTFVAEYDGKTLGSSRANWSVIQGEDGLIYVGNSDGILSYDGSNWELIKMPRGGGVRSFGKSSAGEIFVGGDDDFGKLVVDNSGSSSFESFITESELAVSDVWHTHVIDDLVYFQTNERLFASDGSKLLWSIGSDTSFHTSFEVGGRLWVREKGVGLRVLQDRTLVTVEGGSYLADTRVYSMLSNSENSSLLLATRELGLLQYSNGIFSKLETEASAYLVNHSVYGGTQFGGYNAFATLTGGVVVTNEDGRLVHVLDSDNLLGDSVINYVFWDSTGGLWIAMHNGALARVDIPTPKTVFDKRLKSEGNVAAILKIGKSLYVASGAGLFQLSSPTTTRESYFRQVNGIPIAKDLLNISNESILVGTEEGLFDVSNANNSRIIREPAQAIVQSKVRPSTVWVGTEFGLVEVTKKPGGEWSVANHDTVEEDIRSLAEGTDGVLWMGLRNDGVFSISIDNLRNGTPVRYDTTHGLPVGTPQVELIADQPAFFFEEGFFRYDSLRNYFVVDSSIVPPYASVTNALLDVYEDPKGNIWSVFTDAVYVASEDSIGSYTINRHPHLSFKRENVSQIYVEESGLIWISSGNELVRYDPSIEKSYDLKYPPMVRRVTASRLDSVIFHGATAPGEGPPVPSLKYAENDIRIDFAAPEFNAPEKTTYSYKLHGYANEWSEWSTETFVDFNNLREGQYILSMRAMNSMGYISPEGSYAFVILPPWYRTWWSFLLFAALFLGLAFFSLKYYLMAVATKRAQEQARELARERVVNEKLQEANEQLQFANTRLTEVNGLKDEFLATTSHELRTPLTAILGYAAILKEEISGPHREFVEIIEQSSNRLMHTLNSVLDLAKLRSGTTELNPTTVNLNEKVEGLATAYSEIARTQGVEIICHTPPIPVFVFADEYAIATIIDSLVDNAVKFTQEGEINIFVEQVGDQALIKVRDDGVGMDEDFVPKIFDEFRQESDGLSRSHNGNGLGLSIVAKMVELLDGRISVTSQKGQGSEFVVSLKALDENTESPVVASDRPPIENNAESVAPLTKKSDSGLSELE